MWLACRNGILQYVFSDNPALLLLSLYLLLNLAESKGTWLYDYFENELNPMLTISLSFHMYDPDCDSFLSRTIGSIVLPHEKVVLCPMQ